MKKFIIYISTFSLFALAGCDNYLDTIPDNRTEIDTPEKVSELLVGAYPAASYQAFCEIMSDNVNDNYDNSPPSPIYSKPYFWEDVLQTDTDSPQFYWSACYRAIAASNKALEAIAKLGGGANLNPQKGEALVARAYSHFMLVCLFSKFYDPATATSDLGIPYVTEPEKVVIQKYDRSTVQVTYDKIQKDLLEGLPLISDQVYKVPAYHFNTNAANAFASRFFLFKRDYDKVIEYASKVAGSGGFIVNMRSWANYRTMNVNTVLAEYSKATEKANLLLAETSSLWGRYYLGRIRYGLSNNLANSLYGTDFNPAPNPSGGAFLYQRFSINNESTLLPKYNELFISVSPSANIGNAYNMNPLFTTEEVLLNRAEAYLYKNDGTNCLADLNTFLSQRVGTLNPNTGQIIYNPAAHTLTIAKNNAFYGATNAQSGGALLQTIIDFRRREFIHEGMRWFDLLRYNIPVTHTNFNGTSQTLAAGDKRRVLQIPQEASLSGMPLNPR
jgi:starch-binding outer membrane protein, SusD/RagB family